MVCCLNNFLILLICLTLSILLNASLAEDPANSIDLHIVVVTQQNHPIEFRQALQLREQLLKNDKANKNFLVTLLYENSPDLENENNSALLGHWAIWPVLGRFSTSQRLAKWTLFCSAFVQIPIVEALIEYLLRNHDHLVPMFLGNAYFDESPVIIHHYHDGFLPMDNGKVEENRERFPYPDISTGFLLSSAALKIVIEGFGKQGNKILPNFVIDPGFEFAQIVFALSGATLKEDSRFCGYQSLEENGHCLIEFNMSQLKCPADMDAKNLSSKIFYAVKTHAGNHLSRVPIIKRTWAKQVAVRIGYFSDFVDKLIPTINLGVVNTERGHCGKTLAILEYFLANITEHGENFPSWLVLADDDTLLSVPRLERLIQCFSQNEEKPIIIGQRYGYGFGVAGTNGYDYPTGGAGIIFSRKAVELLNNGCACSSIDSPDDMIIGLCARRLGIPIIHSGAFHQARPIDYHEKQLKMWEGRHISFHKFEELQVDEVYAELLHENGTHNDGNVQRNHDEF